MVSVAVPTAATATVDGAAFRASRTFFKIVCVLIVIASITYNSRRAALPIEIPRRKCALLFFGLVKDSFRSLSLPSIKRHIVENNADCDIFLHTYNLSHVPPNERNGERISPEVNVSQAYLLTNNVALEDVDRFDTERKRVLERTRKFYHRGWGECCLSHDNMIKQWHSIEGVWNLMQRSEEERGVRFPQIGLFRSDVYYTRAIDIFDSKGAAPNFARHGGYNDRLFYGSYASASVWASQRFNFTDVFEEKYIKPYKSWKPSKDGYHSETYVKKLMDHHRINVEMKDHCVWRVRSGRKIQVGDCEGMDGFSTISEARSYAPPINDYIPIL